MITRRVASLGVAALLLAGAGIAVAATRQPGVDTVTATAEVPPATTTTAPTPPSTSTTSPFTSTSTSAPTTTTTARIAATTTTRRTVTTVAPPSTSTAPPAPACTPAQIQVTATAGRPSYGPGENAEVTTVLRNRSAAPCSYNGYTVEVTFRDARGAAFGGSTVVADTFRPVSLAAGATLTHTDSWRHILQPAGPHTGTATWRFGGSRYEATASFQLT